MNETGILFAFGVLQIELQRAYKDKGAFKIPRRRIFVYIKPQYRLNGLPTIRNAKR
jgi:hypothetical protein